MQTLTFSVRIEAPAQKVWETMIAPDSYPIWVGASWPGSFYRGTWEQDAQIRFISADGSGTLAVIRDIRPFELITAEHIALLLEGGVEDTSSDLAKDWVGIMEQYELVEENNLTTVTASLRLKEMWSPMFEKGFPGALAKLKEICETMPAPAHA